jgi:hypothetical protein
VRASSGQKPRRRSIMPRHSINRRYRPCFDNLESKQLLSAGVLTDGAHAVVHATVPVSSHAEVHHAISDGTGKGIVIITP